MGRYDREERRRRLDQSVRSVAGRRAVAGGAENTEAWRRVVLKALPVSELSERSFFVQAVRAAYRLRLIRSV